MRPPFPIGRGGRFLLRTEQINQGNGSTEQVRPCMTRFRTALIGAGFISTTHIEALKTAVPETELVAIVDRNLALAKSRAAQWGIPNVYGDIEELIAAGTAAVVHVLAPPDLHAPITRRLLEAGLHVQLEKPMA